MTKQIFTALTVIGLALALNTTPAQAASASANELHRLEKQVNQATQTSQQWHTAMHTISVQTGVSQEQLRTMKKDHPKAEPAAILIASVLADQTKKAPEQFLQKHLSGQNWTEIARDNKVPLDQLNQRLQKVQQALTAGGTSNK